MWETAAFQALLLVLLHCVSVEAVCKNIDWCLLILIAEMTAFGKAMTDSGAVGMVVGVWWIHFCPWDRWPHWQVLRR